jgi:serine/threonine-protein kinase
MIGCRISCYEVLEKLGEGGMGVVYKARDTRLGRSVAIKVVNAEFTQRFEREARAISALNHPHICTLYDVGEHEGSPYLVMEYVDGKPLKGPLPVSDALRYAVQIGQALAAAHKAGIVHRDLKPDNLLLTSQGSVKVLDFGLAKLQPTVATGASTLTIITEQGAIAGTGPYMSPEQAQGEPVDARSDIFSFGAVLYELLSGRQAFRREAIGATLAAVIASEPPPLWEAPPDAGRIVAKMLAKKREGRYQSAEELLADLDAVAQPGSRFMSRSLWFVQKFRGLPAGAAVAVLAVALIAGSIWWPRGKDAVPSIPEVAALSPAEALQRAQAYLQRFDRKGNVDRAMDTLQAALQRDPSSAALQAVLAEACVRKYLLSSDKQWLQMAITSGRQAVAANDDLAAGHVALGMALAASGQSDEAASQFERARDLNPLSGPAHLGLAKLRSGPEAEQLYRKAVQYSPGEWTTANELAAFYYFNGRYDESIAVWRQARQLTPDNVKVLGNLAAGLHMNGQYAEAADTFQRALELDATDAQTWANLGTARYFQGDYLAAVRAMAKAVELAPHRYLYWGNLGDSYRWAEGLKSRAGRAYENAIRLVRERLAATPNDAETRSSLAVYLAKLGDTAGALAELAQVEKVPGRGKGILFKTALVYELAGDRDKALAALGRAIGAGYSRHEIANEPELAALRSDPRYLPMARAGAALKK